MITIKVAVGLAKRAISLIIIARTNCYQTAVQWVNGAINNAAGKEKTPPMQPNVLYRSCFFSSFFFKFYFYMQPFGI